MALPSTPQSTRARFNISRFAIQYPWLTLGFWIAVMVAGLFAFSSLKFALFPDVTFPVVVVTAKAPIATAEKTEQQLTIPIERSVQFLKAKQGLTRIVSSSYPGQAVVSLSFVVGTKLDQATRSVETALEQVKLPTQTEYEVTPINLNEAAVVSYAVSSSTEKLSTLTATVQSKILPAIAKVPGVRKVSLVGVPAGTKISEPKATPGQAEKVVQQPGTTAARWDGKNVLAFDSEATPSAKLNRDCPELLWRRDATGYGDRVQCQHL